MMLPAARLPSHALRIHAQALRPHLARASPQLRPWPTSPGLLESHLPSRAYSYAPRARAPSREAPLGGPDQGWFELTPRPTTAVGMVGQFAVGIMTSIAFLWVDDHVFDGSRHKLFGTGKRKVEEEGAAAGAAGGREPA